VTVLIAAEIERDFTKEAAVGEEPKIPMRTRIWIFLWECDAVEKKWSAKFQTLTDRPLSKETLDIDMALCHNRNIIKME